MCNSVRSPHRTTASIHAYVHLYHIVYAEYHHLSRCPLVSVGQRDEVIVTAMLNSNGSFIKFTTLFSLNRPTTTYQMLRLSLTSSLYNTIWACVCKCVNMFYYNFVVVQYYSKFLNYKCTVSNCMIFHIVLHFASVSIDPIEQICRFAMNFDSGWDWIGK